MTVVRDDEKGQEQKYSATLDEAMLLTGFGLFNILHMLLCGMILMGVVMQSLALGYVLPAAQCDLDLTMHQKGLLAALPFLAIILMSYFWGYLGDTRGRRPVIFYSMLMSAGTSIAASFAPEVISFAVLQFLTGVFTSGSTALVYTYLGEFNNLNHRDKMVTFGSSFVGIGVVVLPAISWLILPLDFALPIFTGVSYRSWRLLVVACALPYVISSFFMLFSPESPKFLHAAGQQEECLKVLKKIYLINKFKSADTFPIKSLVTEGNTKTDAEAKTKPSLLSSMRDQTFPLFRKPLLRWTCLVCFVQFGIFASTNGFYVWIPTILNSLASHEGAEITICEAIMSKVNDVPVNNTVAVQCDDTLNTSTFELSIYIGLIFCTMYVIVGFLVNLVDKKFILVVVFIVTGACGFGAHLSSNQTIAIVMFAVFQMSGACIGLTNAIAVELTPTKYRAMAICLAMMIGRTGSVVGSSLIGVLLKNHCGLSFYLFSGLTIVNGLLCITLPQRKRINKDKKTVESTQYQTHEPE